MRGDPSDVMSESGNEEIADPVMVPKELRDRSPAARAARRKIMFGAVTGELVATFIFVYVNCAAAINLSGTFVKPLAGAIVAGLMLTAIAYSFAEISGAHVNPAVTFATWLSGKTSNRKSLFYMVAQLIGSVLAMLMIMATFPSPIDNIKANFALTGAVSSKANAFFMEFMLTFIFVFIIFTVAFEIVESKDKSAVHKLKADKLGREIGLTLYTANPQSKAGFAPLAIGFTCTCLALMGGSVSGGAFNPARAFGPAIVTGQWDDHWIYWIGDFAGAATAAALRKAIKVYLTYTQRLAQQASKHRVPTQAELAAASSPTAGHSDQHFVSFSQVQV